MNYKKENTVVDHNDSAIISDLLFQWLLMLQNWTLLSAVSTHYYPSHFHAIFHQIKYCSYSLFNTVKNILFLLSDIRCSAIAAQNVTNKMLYRNIFNSALKSDIPYHFTIPACGNHLHVVYYLCINESFVYIYVN